MPSPAPDVSVVIPVFNAEASLEALVHDLLAAPSLRVEVILVDDASTDGSGKLADRLAADIAGVTALHHEDNRGAGVARNNGFEQARGRYTLFFDADDLVNVGVLEDVVRELDVTRADVGFTTYRYLRGDQLERDGMNGHDVEIWERAMPRNQLHHTTRLTEVPTLLGFANYPWNKVVRTSRYRETSLAFGTTSVHNDILGHWHILLFARRVLLVNREMCTHIVEPSGANLTNRRSRHRLELFDALDETYDLLRRHPGLRSRYAHHYWSFVIRTARWASPRIGADHNREFNARLQRHLLRLEISDLAHMRLSRDAALADDLLATALA